MGDTSIKLQEKTGSNLDPEAAVSSGNTQHSDPEYSKTSETDIANTDGPNKPESNDSGELDPKSAKISTPPNTTSPSSLNNRYDIYPGTPLPEFNSPSAQAFKVQDRMQPQLKLFGLICLPGLPIRLNEIEKISGKILPGNLDLVSFGNIDWPIAGQKCLVLIFKSPLGQRVEKFLQAKEIPNIKKIDAIKLVSKVGCTSLFSLR